MCSPVRCRKCGKTTWSGCGRHVDQVMARVPHDQRCTCADTDGGQPGGLVMRLFRAGRR